MPVSICLMVGAEDDFCPSSFPTDSNPSMSSQMFAESVPFPLPLLHEDRGTNSPFYGDARRTEKDFDPATLLESLPLAPGPKPPGYSVTEAFHRARGCGSKFLSWPVMVILGQLLLQFMAWGFFIVVKVRGQISLPFGLALWAKHNGHLVTLLVTLISTMLSGLSSL